MTISRSSRPLLAALLAAVVPLGACGRGAPSSGSPAPAGEYPEPRFPSYLKPVSTVEEVLPHVRPLARNKTGVQGAGLGVANPGETVTFVTTSAADPLIVEAVKRAMEERGVKVNVVPEYEMGSTICPGITGSTRTPISRRTRCTCEAPTGGSRCWTRGG